MHERKEGHGRLETVEPPEKVWQVSYQFDFTTDIVRTPGSPSVAGQRHNRGTIHSRDGKPIPEGTYQLHTDDEIMRVKNVGLETWVILKSA
jgi:hypothetical protein